MLNESKEKRNRKLKRKFRVRKRIFGTADCPRLNVSKSNRHVYVQLINDEASLTLVGVGTMSKTIKGKKSKSFAKILGEKISEKAKEININKLVFDRNAYKYHGIVAEIATAAREAGMQF